VTSKQAEALIQIGEAAERTGLSLRTLRHWDEVGLVTPSARSEGGFRLYSIADLERIGIIKTMKPLDLSLEEIRELLELLVATRDGAATCEHAQRIEHYQERTNSCMERLTRHLTYASDLLEMLDVRSASRHRATT
jgi:DNA-binding transcriptional MerR regulator